MAKQPGREHRILIVDDHALIRRGLAALIGQEDDLFVCGEATELAQAMKIIRELTPDLILVDLTLASGNGLELVKHVVAAHPYARMLVCTMHDEKIYAERCLRAGAHGFINKEAAGDEVITAIRTILSGKPYVSNELSQRLVNRVINGQSAIETSPVQRLTDRQLEVFELIGQGLSTREVAEKLHLSPKTIESYRENIKAKLSLKSGHELTRHAIQWVMEHTNARLDDERQ